MIKKDIPYEFVFDYLTPLDVTIKPMFGLWAIYINEKIVLALRDRKEFPDSNGVWVATSQEHHKSLKSEFPSLRSFTIFSKAIKETEWQMLPVDADDFEASVIKVCELIKRNDNRIGKIPKPKQKKNS